MKFPLHRRRSSRRARDGEGIDPSCRRCDPVRPDSHHRHRGGGDAHHPIVFATAADRRAGFVESLARPGSKCYRVHQQSRLYGREGVEYLKEIVAERSAASASCSAQRIAPRGANSFFDPMRDVAASFGVELSAAPLGNPRRSTASSPRCRVMRPVGCICRRTASPICIAPGSWRRWRAIRRRDLSFRLLHDRGRAHVLRAGARSQGRRNMSI